MEDSDDVIFIECREGEKPEDDDVLPFNYFAQETNGRLSPQNGEAKGQHDKNNNQPTNASIFKKVDKAPLFDLPSEVNVINVGNMLQGINSKPGPTWTYITPWINATHNLTENTTTSAVGTSSLIKPEFQPFLICKDDFSVPGKTGNPQKHNNAAATITRVQSDYVPAEPPFVNFPPAPWLNAEKIPVPAFGEFPQYPWMNVDRKPEEQPRNQKDATATITPVQPDGQPALDETPQDPRLKSYKEAIEQSLNQKDAAATVTRVQSDYVPAEPPFVNFPPAPWLNAEKIAVPAFGEFPIYPWMKVDREPGEQPLNQKDAAGTSSDVEPNQVLPIRILKRNDFNEPYKIVHPQEQNNATATIVPVQPEGQPAIDEAPQDPRLKSYKEAIEQSLNQNDAAGSYVLPDWISSLQAAGLAGGQTRTRKNAHRETEEPIQRNIAGNYVLPDWISSLQNAAVSGPAGGHPRTRKNAHREPEEPIQRNVAGSYVLPDWVSALQNAAATASGLAGGHPRTRKNAHREPEEPIRRNPPRSAKVVPNTDAKAKKPRKEKSVSPKNAEAKPAPTAKTKSKSQDGRKRKVQKVEEPPFQPQPSTSAAKKEEESDYQRLLNLQTSSLVSSMEDASCPVCQRWVQAGEGVVLKDCLHTFCRKCLQNAVLCSQMAEVRCPFANEEYSCESHLQDCEVKCLVSPDDYERHLAKSVFQARCQATNAFFCMTEGCTGWCILDDDINDFRCPVCKQHNCIPCSLIHKEGEACMHDVIMLHSVPDVQIVADTREQEHRVGSSSSVQQQGGDDYHSLLELSDVGLVMNKEKFDCPICFCEIEVGEGVILKDCLHNYCRECLTGTVKHSETVLVKCPFVNEEYACDSFLQEREIKSLVSPEDYERHLARSLAQVEHQSSNSFHCKTPDCAGWCLFEGDANEFYCQTCNHTNCLGCGAIHEGQNCRQFQELKEFNSDDNVEVRKTREYLEKQVKKNLAMKCPTCQVIVMKRDGCDWLKCSMCKTGICWATKGPRWGPKGIGDTSGGCGCDFRNGRPCHPKCQNCH